MTQRSGNARIQYLPRGLGSQREEMMLPRTKRRGLSPESWEQGGGPPQELPHVRDTTGRRRKRVRKTKSSVAFSPPGPPIHKTQQEATWHRSPVIQPMYSGSRGIYRWRAELSNKSGEATEFHGAQPRTECFLYHPSYSLQQPVLLASLLSY